MVLGAMKESVPVDNSGGLSMQDLAELTDLRQEPSRQQEVRRGRPQHRSAFGKFKDARGQCGWNTRKERDYVAKFGQAKQESQKTPRILLRELGCLRLVEEG